MYVVQQPGPDLPYGTVQGASRSDSTTFFGLHLYLAGRCSAKIPKLPRAPRNVNPTGQ